MDTEKVIRNAILSIERPFKLRDIITVLKQYDICDEKVVLKVMLDLCNTGCVYNQGDLFYIPKNNLVSI